jgi:hypothetical protein
MRCASRNRRQVSSPRQASAPGLLTLRAGRRTGAGHQSGGSNRFASHSIRTRTLSRIRVGVSAQHRRQQQPLRWHFAARLIPPLDSCATTEARKSWSLGSPLSFSVKKAQNQSGLVSRLSKDYFSHELRAEDIPNLRPIHIPLHALFVVYTSSLTEHFIGFLLILLK